MTASSRNVCGARVAAARRLRYDSLVTTMKLITAHKILIGSATVFFVFFALWEGRNYAATADGWAALRSGLYIIVAAGFAIYLKNLKRWYK